MPKFSLLILLLYILSATTGRSAGFKPDEIEILQRALKGRYQESYVEQLFASKKVKRYDDLLQLNVTKPIELSMDRYGHFTEPYAIGLAKRFQRRWRTVLSRAQKKFEVDKHLIVGILLVETSFGKFTGNYQLLSVFSSLVVDCQQWFTSKPASPDDRLQKRVQRKYDWALGELIALLKIKQKHPRFNLYRLRGSYAGAFGKAQFLPSSYLAFAVPYNRKGTPDLHFEADAIYSIANYLKANGYRQPFTSKASRKALFHYNNSQVYVQTIIDVAKKLKGQSLRSEEAGLSQ